MKQTTLPYDLEYRHYNLPVDFPVIALLGSRWRLPDEELTFLHFHNCLEIGYCYNGSGVLVIENQELTFQANDVTIVCNNTLHRSKSTKGTSTDWEYLYIDIKQLFKTFFPSGFPNQEALLFNSPEFINVFSKKKYPFINSLVMNTLDELRFEKDNYELSVKGLLLSLFMELTREIPVVKTSANPLLDYHLPIMPAIMYIYEHYMLPIKIEELAQMCHLSTTHFRRLFGESMHTNPLTYINHIRVRKSCILLHNTEDSILDISLQVGFPTISSYNRHFHSIMNTAPLKWRNMSRSIHKKDFKYSVFDF